MESRAKLFGHPIHVMLIVFPLGLLITSFIFDLIFLATGNDTWAEVSYYMISAGIIGGLVAAPFGTIDWLAIPNGTRAKAFGLWHGVGNVVLLMVFGLSWILRRDDPATPGNMPLFLSFLGILLGSLTAWLGGELVNKMGVGIADDANLNGPASRLPTPASRTDWEGEGSLQEPGRQPSKTTPRD